MRALDTYADPERSSGARSLFGGPCLLLQRGRFLDVPRGALGALAHTREHLITRTGGSLP